MSRSVCGRPGTFEHRRFFGLTFSFSIKGDFRLSTTCKIPVNKLSPYRAHSPLQTQVFLYEYLRVLGSKAPRKLRGVRESTGACGWRGDLRQEFGEPCPRLQG